MSNKEILGKVYKMIPPMLEHFHKGKPPQSSTSISLDFGGMDRHVPRGFGSLNVEAIGLWIVNKEIARTQPRLFEYIEQRR